MKQFLLLLLVSQSVFSGVSHAMDRGNIVQAELKNLLVSKIAVSAERKKVIATLQQGCVPVVGVRGGGDGPKPLENRSFQFELDPADEVDGITYQLLLKTFGSFNTVNIGLGSSGQISSVELAGPCVCSPAAEGGHCALPSKH